MQNDAPAITVLAAEITASASNEKEKITSLAHWVYNEIEKRPVIGLPDALTVLATLQGDCNEHSSLLAALARAAGIPTRVVAGVTHLRGAFYYHAWNEACVNHQWISIDSTIGQVPAPLDRLRFIIGDTEEQVRLGGLLGKIEIEIPPQDI
jgi:transglutaminase-like putative cysteine protease